MTLEEAQAILRTITYRKGWQFEYSGEVLSLEAPLEGDTTGNLKLTGGETYTIQRGCEVPLAVLINEQCFIEVVYNEIKFIELHELNEWFKVNGRKWRSPHGPGSMKALKTTLCGDVVSR